CCSKRGISASSKPLSWVLVVVASMMSLGLLVRGIAEGVGINAALVEPVALGAAGAPHAAQRRANKSHAKRVIDAVHTCWRSIIISFHLSLHAAAVQSV